MNEKFYSLPEEKQQRIINAGFSVFSQNSYKKSSMNDIAQQAQISKSLLFFYFRNKRELYLFLWDTACRLTGEIQSSYRELLNQKAGQVLARLDPGDFRPGLDLRMMHRQMFLASEGYLWEISQQGGINRQQLRQDFEALLAFWKKVYCREGNT